MAGWIGVDLDGTLAEYHGWKGLEEIGKPIPKMVERVKYWRSKGIVVKIFTARVGSPDYSPTGIEAWCRRHIGEVLPITDRKDFEMVQLWDDRCIQVRTNTGEIQWPT